MIRVKDLVKRHGKEEVLRGITLEVAKGEVAVVIGPSGGGKSTFLRCIIGLEKIDGGRVEVDGLVLDAEMGERENRTVLGHIRRKVGMVFQSFNLFPHRSVLGNVMEAPVHVLRLPEEEAAADARRLLDRVGLAAKLDQMPGTLSGGQMQRVAIARALAMRPEVILFDEPTSALDPRMAAEVQAVMADLARDGQTMVVVTHAMGFARSAGHRVHVFGGGRVIESGTPEEVFGAPRDPVTKEFLSNLQ
jgi:ABC-type polar amino acid transport system ATPase subunit